MNKYNNSSYWLNDWEDDDSIINNMTDVQKKSLDLYKLASSKRAISNFVNIVTNQSIPVKFKERGDSYTDGKSVVIGSKITEPKDFDVAVGLALHEGSHIKLSDFTLLSNIYDLVPTHIKDGSIKKGINNPIAIIKNLWNYVEDRRIDNFVFKSAPGYRGYYRSMYDKYFNDRIIDKGLLSDEYRDVTLDSYMFRIINLHNKNTQLDSLIGLREIYKLVGLNTIGRLTDSKEAFEVALKMYQVILSNLQVEVDENQDGDEKSEENSNDGQGDSSQGMSDDDFNELLESIGESPMGGDGSEQPQGGNSMDIGNTPDNMEGVPTEDNSPSSNPVQLSDKQKQLLKKKIEKQQKFLDGDIQKTTISKTDSKNLNAIEESGSELKEVGKGTKDGYYGNQSVQCIVVKKLTQSLYESDMFPMTRKNWGDDINVISQPYEQEVQDGIRLGTILGKKLQVRGEDRTTVFNRQKVGRIDKRMVSSLGFGNENVFKFSELDSYKKANLHISIDASSSMNGSKWSKTLTNAVSLCKAVDMIQNLSIQVTFRCTSENNKPYIVMAYDSTKDKFSKVKQMFAGLRANGTTPEGLCFEAIQKEFLPSNNDMDSYFLNISDGQPYFPGNGFYYGGDEAVKHTRKMVKMIEGMGIKTLSYFVSDGSYDTYGERDFKQMYGKGAKIIDVTSVSQISKTMNELFLQK
jgi:hypothetical protein|tara:strand:+ start:50 stop:2119 length:2070 start_codon:yes stop_codon:yes gene_type:complete